VSAESEYSDILDRLADKHQERIAAALQELEERVAELMASAPLKDGELFDLEWALSARPELRKLIDDIYLAEVQASIAQYKNVSASALSMLKTYGDFTNVDASVINQLQRLSFQGFEAIAAEYLDVLATEIYQSTLTGRAFSESVKNLRQSINGIYIGSDSLEAKKLVDIAANGTKAQQAAAVEKLQTLYGRDRTGRNLRRYSVQMMQDSLMQFDASINTAIGKESGAEKWKYYGSLVRDSREFCEKRAGKVFTNEEIAQQWSGSWAGKAPGDPFIVRGGYNCRHHWRPVFEE
jgi:hypothetical protein